MLTRRRWWSISSETSVIILDLRNCSYICLDGLHYYASRKFETSFPEKSGLDRRIRHHALRMYTPIKGGIEVLKILSNVLHEALETIKVCHLYVKERNPRPWAEAAATLGMPWSVMLHCRSSDIIVWKQGSHLFSHNSRTQFVEVQELLQELMRLTGRLDLRICVCARG